MSKEQQKEIHGESNDPEMQAFEGLLGSVLDGVDDIIGHMENAMCDCLVSAEAKEFAGIRDDDTILEKAERISNTAYELGECDATIERLMEKRDELARKHLIQTRDLEQSVTTCENKEES